LTVSTFGGGDLLKFIYTIIPQKEAAYTKKEQVSVTKTLLFLLYQIKKDESKVA